MKLNKSNMGRLEFLVAAGVASTSALASKYPDIINVMPGMLQRRAF